MSGYSRGSGNQSSGHRGSRENDQDRSQESSRRRERDRERGHERTQRPSQSIRPEQQPRSNPTVAPQYQQTQLLSSSPTSAQPRAYTYGAERRSSDLSNTAPAQASSAQNVSDLGFAQLSIGRGPTSNPLDVAEPEFQRRSREYFRAGVIFMTQDLVDTGTAASGSGASGDISSRIQLSENPYGERAAYRVQRWVVIQGPTAGNDWCYALPISSYGGGGVRDQGAGRKPVKRHHGIVYSERTSPTPNPDEAPARGEQGMCATPIRIRTVSRIERLPVNSRINYGALTRVSIIGQVHDIGWVHENFRDQLVYQWRVIHQSRDNSSALTSIPENRVSAARSSAQHDSADVNQGEDNEDNDDRPDAEGDDGNALERDDEEASGAPTRMSPEQLRVYQANYTTTQYNTLLRSGRTPQQAMEILIAGLQQRSRSPMSRSDADARIRLLLTYSGRGR